MKKKIYFTKCGEAQRNKHGLSSNNHTNPSVQTISSRSRSLYLSEIGITLNQSPEFNEGAIILPQRRGGAE
jgi:hypothetical protein